MNTFRGILDLQIGSMLAALKAQQDRRCRDIESAVGHKADQLLAESRDRMRKRMHKLLPAGTRTEYRATLARLGGDEFGMLLPTLEQERQAISVARRIIEGLDAEYTINDQKLSLRYCIGFSIYPDHGEREQRPQQHT